MAQRMAIVGNTYYLFDSNGDGMSFTSMGRVVGNVRYENVSLSLRNVQDVQVLSLLGLPTVNKCDVYFDGQAGVSNLSQTALIAKAKQLCCLSIVPFRAMRCEEPGLLQVMYALKPGSTTREYISKLFEVKEWRKAQ